MALDYSRFGTRISLSERFALIRKESQKRSILVNPTIDSPQQEINKNVKNFNGTVSRTDRPSAALQQGSDRNKRLVLQMAVAPSVLAEINQTYNPQIRAQVPKITQSPQIKNQPRSIRQRLGAAQNRNNVNSTKGVKSRLGIKRKPVSQRIGLKSGLIQADSPNNIRSNGKLRPRNVVAFKKKNIIQARNQIQTRNQTLPRNKVAKFNHTKPIRNLRGKPIQPQKPKRVTAEQLDQDLDVYMQNSKGFLNADLDAYMSQA